MMSLTGKRRRKRVDLKKDFIIHPRARKAIEIYVGEDREKASED
jgi:hypothetical protein